MASGTSREVLQEAVDCGTDDVPMDMVNQEELVVEEIVTEQELPELIVEEEKLVKEVPLSASRRIIDLKHFVEEIRKIERHSFECNHGGSLVHVKTIQQGMASLLHYACCKPDCCVTYCVQTANPESLHMESILAATSIGVGYQQMEELFSTIQSPYMSETTSQKYEKRCEDLLAKCEMESILSAIKEEKSMASVAGHVDEEGKAHITVVLDGGWSKRTYGHGFDANSGVAVIIGERTKKILFCGTRNKFCSICTLARKNGVAAKEHHCNSNWAGSSSAMEADILVEGIIWLEEEHGIHCDRIIGDGDSSVTSKIRQYVSYGASIQKVECTNHAIRNYRTKLEAMGSNTRAFRGRDGIKARKLMKAKAARLSAEARGIIRRYAVNDLESITSEAIIQLRAAIDNVPFHVFGQHTNCHPDRTCRQAPQQQEENNVPFLKTVDNFFETMEEATTRLSSQSSTLISNATSNYAENFMSQTAKTVGGKRVDFSKGQGYTRRVRAATLAFNKPAQAWHIDAHRAYYKKSPKSPLLKLVSKRGKKLQRNRTARLNRRLNFHEENSETIQNKEKPQRQIEHAALDYGLCDAEPNLLKQLCDNFYEAKVCINDNKRQEIEKSTRLQGSGSPDEVKIWRKERSIRISASNAKRVCSRRETTPSANLVKSLLYPKEFSNAATNHGHLGERQAKKKYADTYGVTVLDCGLLIDKEYPFLCASPDGIVDNGKEKYLIEVKSPYNARFHPTIDYAIEAFGTKFPLRKDNDGEYFLPEDHEHYYQVQVQLQCANLPKCVYIVYLLKDMAVISINRNQGFMEKHITKMKTFYMECMLPELADSRYKRNLPLREPTSIINAIQAKQAKK